jgi:adenylate cyclase
VAKKTDLDAELLLEHRRALGLPSAADEPTFTDDDVEAAKHLKQFLDAGLPSEEVIEVTRVVGEGMSRVAAAVAALVARTMLSAGDTERDLGMKLAEAAEVLGPVMGRELEYTFRLHLREIVRNEMVTRAERFSGALPDSQTVNVCFADLVGFTKLGEQLPPEEIGRVAGRLSQLAADVVEPPVRLVKTIGDAAMLVSPETEPLIHTSITLVRAADDAEEDFPQLRSGVARGEAIARGGDWYGRPVNVASRVCSLARPGSVLCTEGVHDEAEGEFRWSFAGKRRLKGVKEPVPLFRARRLPDDS